MMNWFNSPWLKIGLAGSLLVIATYPHWFSWRWWRVKWHQHRFKQFKQQKGWHDNHDQE